jgi:hypothetical protein
MHLSGGMAGQLKLLFAETLLMDKFNVSNTGGGNINQQKPSNNNDALIPFDNKPAAPNPLHHSKDDTTISHKPLNLGGTAAPNLPKAAGPAEQKSFVKNPGENLASSDRITGIKTFFTKLHPGAMDFLDEQISDWLKNHPKIVIKQTNTATGLVEGKKIEPSIIVTVWY